MIYKNQFFVWKYEKQDKHPLPGNNIGFFFCIYLVQDDRDLLYHKELITSSFNFLKKLE